MQGTIVNVLTIVLGSILGSILGKRLNKKYSDSSIQCMGLVALSLGITWITSNIPQSTQPLLFIISLVLGNLLGEFLQIDQRVERLQKKYSSSESTPNLIQGLTTTVLLFCLGTFSILGPINAALKQEYTLLYTNALLDGITCIVFAASYGIGIILSAVFLFAWQGSIYFLAQYIAPYMTPEMFTELNVIGGILIMMTGFNILKISSFRTLNFLPAIFISLIYMILLQNYQIG
ncbi:MAG: DUF554 domain-containing protein [Brevinema sp.]